MSLETVGKDNCGCFTGSPGHTYAEDPNCEYFEHHCESCHEKQLCTLMRRSRRVKRSFASRASSARRWQKLLADERERLTKTFAAFVLDRADQLESIELADVAHDIATGEALAKYERGELDDLVPRIEFFQLTEANVNKRKPL